jgi:hypothetical protein
MKTKKILAAALATASCGSLAIGGSLALAHGPAAFGAGIIAFLALALTATLIDPTI